MNPKYLQAYSLLSFYIEKLENEDTEAAKYGLQWINLQMAKFKCQGYLDMLYCYPIDVVNVVNSEDSE